MGWMHCATFLYLELSASDDKLQYYALCFNTNISGSVTDARNSPVLHKCSLLQNCEISQPRKDIV